VATDRIAAQLKSDLMRDFGLTDAQAAGVVGNLMHESGGFQQLQERNPSVKGSEGGYGYAQWTGPRRDKFEEYAKDRGLEPGSYEANYGYLKHELANDPYERRQFNTVKKAQTAEEAARLVSENFLRPGKPNLSERTRLAQQAMSYSPVPPSDIPNAVGTALDVARPAPTPAGPSMEIATRRNMTSPSGGNTDLQSALNTFATREARRVVPATMSQFSGDPGTPAQGQVIASIPSDPQNDPIREATRRAALSMGSNQSMAGQERGPVTSPIAASDRTRGSEPQTRNIATTIASIPSTQPSSASDMARGRSGISTVATIPSIRPSASDLVRGSNGYQTIATYPTTGIGAPPATRSVQSVPMPPQAPRLSASDMVRGNEMQTRNNATTIASFPTISPSDIAPKPAPQFSRAAGFAGGSPTPYVGSAMPYAPQLPGMDAFDVMGKGQDRLSPNVFPMAPGRDMTALTPIQSILPPMPRARPTMTAMRPQQQMPPMPQRRPVPLMSGSLAAMAMPQAPARIVVQAQPSNPNNYSAAQMQAVNDGRSYYTGSDGAVQPTRAMNGNLRYTYGD